MGVGEIIGLIISIISCCTAVLVAVFTARKNNAKDCSADGKKDGVVLTELGYIKSGVDDIKRKQEKQDEQHIEVIERLSAVEQSAKQAHHRIDAIEAKNMQN